MIYVPGEGPSNAKLMIVGEAPAEYEERSGHPFSGPSGMIVNDCLSYAGVNRSEVYVTNVVKIRLPNNDIKKLHLIGKKIEDFLPQLAQEIEKLKPNCILAFGGTALEALTGLKGIEKYRGSILKSIYGPKVVGTIHPAALLHKESKGMKSWKDLTYIKWDVKRAADQSKFPEYNPPQRNLTAAQNHLQFYRFMNMYQKENLVSIDIETFKTFPICIALSYTKESAISVPLLSHDITESDKVQIWRDVSDLMADPKIFKIGQNFTSFDEVQLRSCYNRSINFGIITRSFYFDTRSAWKVLYPELPAKLQMISSIMTEEPYYKDEGKEYNPKKDNFSRLMLYNAKDAAVTFECYEKELEELHQRKLTDFFFTKIMPLHPLYSRIESRGLNVDKSVRAELKTKYEFDRKIKQEELNNLCGMEINVNSTKQVPILLYNHLNIPVRKGTDEKTLDALMRNTVKDPRKKSIINLILEIRKIRKTIGTYINAELHPDNRLRAGYNILLETGRTSTSVLKPPVTTETMGIALQTLTKHGEIGADLREMIIPDPGYIFIEPDLSQAEARVIAVLANDERAMKMFEYGIDIHRVTAGWINGIGGYDSPLLEFFQGRDEEKIKELVGLINGILKTQISEDQRQLGKVIRHAGNLGIGKREASKTAGISEWRAGQILDKFHSMNPNIKKVFHEGIIECLKKGRTLTNPFNRTRLFLNRWGNDLFKEAFAQIPQSTVSDQTKFAMKRIEKRCWDLEVDFQLLVESHDSFLSQVPIEHAEKIYPIIREELESEIDFSLCSLGKGKLTIPCDIKIGKKNWLEMEKI